MKLLKQNGVLRAFVNHLVIMYKIEVLIVEVLVVCCGWKKKVVFNFLLFASVSGPHFCGPGNYYGYKIFNLLR